MALKIKFFEDSDVDGVEHFLNQFPFVNSDNTPMEHLDKASAFSSLRSHSYLANQNQTRSEEGTSLRLEKYCEAGLTYIEKNFSTSKQVQVVLNSILCASAGDEGISLQILSAMIDNLKTVPQSRMSINFLEQVSGIITMLDCRFNNDPSLHSCIADGISVLLIRQAPSMPFLIGKSIGSVFFNLTEQDQSRRWQVLSAMPLLYNDQRYWRQGNNSTRKMLQYFSWLSGRQKLGDDDAIESNSIFVGPQVRMNRRNIIFWSSGGHVPTVFVHENPLKPIQYLSGHDRDRVCIEEGYVVSRSNVSLREALERLPPTMKR